jgi:hypothetical protein
MAALVLAAGVAEPASGKTIAVPPGGDLQLALNAAAAGDIVELEPGATYAGNFTLPAFAGTTPVVLRTRGVLPDRRITSADASLLARLVSRNGEPVLTTAPGAHHWTLQGLALTHAGRQTYDLLRIGLGTERDRAAMPHHIVVDRCYLFVADDVEQRRGVAANGNDITIVRSWISNMKEAGADSQAIFGRQGERLTIVDNYLEAAGENLLFGGADPGLEGAVPSDIVIRDNTIAKPLSWRGGRWQVKNLLELKNARRVRIERNVLENNWAHAQDGTAILFTTRNQDGKCAWCVIESVTFEYNVVRGVGAGVTILGYDDLQPSRQARDIRLRHNLFVDVSARRWGGSGYFLLLLGEPREVVVDHNTIVSPDGGGVVAVEGPPVRGFVFTNNLARHNKYGIHGAGLGVGNPAIQHFFPGGVVTRNVFAGDANPGNYPNGNEFPGLERFEQQFVDYARGNFALRPASRWTRSASDGGALGADTGRLPLDVRPARPAGSQARSVVSEVDAAAAAHIGGPGGIPRDARPSIRRRQPGRWRRRRPPDHR